MTTWKEWVRVSAPKMLAAADVERDRWRRRRSEGSQRWWWWVKDDRHGCVIPVACARKGREKDKEEGIVKESLRVF